MTSGTLENQAQPQEERSSATYAPSTNEASRGALQEPTRGPISSRPAVPHMSMIECIAALASSAPPHIEPLTGLQSKKATPNSSEEAPSPIKPKVP